MKPITSLDKIKIKIHNRHGDLVSIVESSYTGSSKKATFIDKEYGAFTCTPYGVFARGIRHPKVTAINRARGLTKSIEYILQKLLKVHHGAISLDISTYINTKKKATFIDKEYGAWEALPSNVLFGSGHPKREMEKKKNTNMARYGVEFTSSLISVKEKIKQTMIEEYGVENPFQHGEIREKVKNTLLKNYGVDHPSKSQLIRNRTKDTLLKNYGVDSPAKNKEIALRQAKSANNSYLKIHWKTGKELICQGSYESKVVDYLNKNKMDFNWQPETFTMPNGKTYRPDLFLIEENKFVEIKGYMRKDAQEKWDWFVSTFPNSELWDKNRLEIMEII
jgi:hypothetical protein